MSVQHDCDGYRFVFVQVFFLLKVGKKYIFILKYFFVEVWLKFFLLYSFVKVWLKFFLLKFGFVGQQPCAARLKQTAGAIKSSIKLLARSLLRYYQRGVFTNTDKHMADSQTLIVCFQAKKNINRQLLSVHRQQLYYNCLSII